jgi:hypothetical protein
MRTLTCTNISTMFVQVKVLIFTPNQGAFYSRFSSQIHNVHCYLTLCMISISSLIVLQSRHHHHLVTCCWHDIAETLSTWRLTTTNQSNIGFRTLLHLTLFILCTNFVCKRLLRRRMGHKYPFIPSSYKGYICFCILNSLCK